MNVVDQSVLRQYCSIFLFFLTGSLSSGTAIAFNIINQTSPLLLIHLMHRPNIYHSYCISVGAWKVLRLVLRLLLTPHFVLMWCMLLLHNSIWIFEMSPVESSSIDTVRWHSTAYLPAKYLADWRLSRRLWWLHQMQVHTAPDLSLYAQVGVQYSSHRGLRKYKKDCNTGSTKFRLVDQALSYNIHSPFF